MIKLSLPVDQLSSYVRRLLLNFFPDGATIEEWSEPLFRRALERCEYCFSQIRRKYYCEDGVTVFDHLNADHMASFLYFLGNTLWQDTGAVQVPTKLSYLNKVMHGLDLFHSVAMPDIFLLVHPVGTVLGNARYSNFLVVYQNCTVGAVGKDYPVFGTGTILYSRASVLGKCHIGDDTVFAANSAVIGMDVPDCSVVLGIHPDCRIVTNTESVRTRCFS
jgi:serine O-acetyltransferase